MSNPTTWAPSGIRKFLCLRPLLPPPQCWKTGRRKIQLFPFYFKAKNEGIPIYLQKNLCHRQALIRLHDSEDENPHLQSSPCTRVTPQECCYSFEGGGGYPSQGYCQVLFLPFRPLTNSSGRKQGEVGI